MTTREPGINGVPGPACAIADPETVLAAGNAATTKVASHPRKRFIPAYPRDAPNLRMEAVRASASQRLESNKTRTLCTCRPRAGWFRNSCHECLACSLRCAQRIETRKLELPRKRFVQDAALTALHPCSRSSRSRAQAQTETPHPLGLPCSLLCSAAANPATSLALHLVHPSVCRADDAVHRG